MNELEIIKKKYEGALQMAMQQADAIFTLSAQLEITKAEIEALKELVKCDEEDVKA